jgi:hypothetical protein
MLTAHGSLSSVAPTPVVQMANLAGPAVARLDP